MHFRLQNACLFFVNPIEANFAISLYFENFWDTIFSIGTITKPIPSFKPEVTDMCDIWANWRFLTKSIESWCGKLKILCVRIFQYLYWNKGFCTSLPHMSQRICIQFTQNKNLHNSETKKGNFSSCAYIHEIVFLLVRTTQQEGCFFSINICVQYMVQCSLFSSQQYIPFTW